MPQDSLKTRRNVSTNAFVSAADGSSSRFARRTRSSLRRMPRTTVLARAELQRVAEHRPDDVEALADSLRIAGEVDDERVAARAGDRAREPGQRLQARGLGA